MVGYLTGIELRRHWRSVALLALLVALVVGTVLASVAEARRSRTAFDRYVELLNPPDVMAFGDPGALAALGELPVVEASLPFESVATFPSEAPDDYFPMIISLDGRIPEDYLRFPVVQGRLPDPAAPLEVVGIVRDQGDIGSRSSDLTLTFLTPAFRERYSPDELGSLDAGTFVALREGADVAELSSVVTGEDVELDTSFVGELVGRQAAPTMRAIATALYVFAAVAALAGLATVAHAAARMQQTSALDDRTLAALGVGRAGRWARLAIPGLAAVLIGTPAGVVAAVAASRWFPLGLARRAEPDPGLHVDAFTLVAGTGVALVIGGALVAALAMLSARAEPRATPMGWLGRAAAGAGAPPPVVTGLAFASGTARANGSPGRAAIAGTVVGVVGVIAATTFAASVDRLVADPALYGWGWDANIEGADVSGLPEGAVDDDELLADEDLEAVAEVVFQVEMTFDGNPDPTIVATDLKGHVAPVVVRGAEPRGADEVALGRDSLGRLDKHIGDEVVVDIGGGPQPMRISGVVALPVSDDGGSSAFGAYLTGAAAERLGFDGRCGEDDACYQNTAVRVGPGVELAEVVARYEDPEAGVAVDLPRPPGEIERLTAVEQLPRYLAGFLALLAGIAVTYAAGTTVRRRRRDLAMLRTLGMTAHQLRSVVAVQVLALTVGGALVGTILGVVAGRQVWRLVVDSVPLPFSPAVPLVAVVLVPIATVVLTQLAATFSRRAAGRTHAALALRAE